MSRVVVLDANVVLRILLGGPPAMAEEAFDAVTRLREEGASLILPPIALAEVVWTLERSAKVARADVAVELVDFLPAFGISVPLRAWVDALTFYGEYNLPYGDAVLAATMREAGQEEILSFDEASTGCLAFGGWCRGIWEGRRPALPNFHPASASWLG